MIWRVRRHITVQIQRFCQCSWTNDHISSASRISSGCAGKSVSSIFGFCSSFFEPARQRISTDAKGALNTSHTGAFIVCTKNLLFFLSTITVFRLQDTALATVFAPELLIAIGVMTILDYILALAMSTTADYRFCYHTPRLSRFTYFEPLPIFLPRSAQRTLRFNCPSKRPPSSYRTRRSEIFPYEPSGRCSCRSVLRFRDAHSRYGWRQRSQIISALISTE